MEQLTDAELLALIRGGDRQAESAFAERHTAWARVYATKLGAGDLADDVAQNVMIDMISRPPRALSTASARAYMGAAIWHELIRARGRKRTEQLPPSGGAGLLNNLGNFAMADNGTSPSAAAHRREILRAASQALDELATGERVVVSLRCIQGLSYCEISNITGRAEGTERVSYHRGMAKLRQKLFEFLRNETAGNLPGPLWGELSSSR